MVNKNGNKWQKLYNILVAGRKNVGFNVIKNCSNLITREKNSLQESQNVCNEPKIFICAYREYVRREKKTLL